MTYIPKSIKGLLSGCQKNTLLWRIGLSGMGEQEKRTRLAVYRTWMSAFRTLLTVVAFYLVLKKVGI